MTTPNRGSPGLDLVDAEAELARTRAGTLRSPIRPSRDCECGACSALYVRYGWQEKREMEAAAREYKGF